MAAQTYATRRALNEALTGAIVDAATTYLNENDTRISDAEWSASWWDTMTKSVSSYFAHNSHEQARELLVIFGKQATDKEAVGAGVEISDIAGEAEEALSYKGLLLAINNVREGLQSATVTSNLSSLRNAVNSALWEHANFKVVYDAYDAGLDVEQVNKSKMSAETYAAAGHGAMYVSQSSRKIDRGWPKTAEWDKRSLSDGEGLSPGEIDTLNHNERDECVGHVMRGLVSGRLSIGAGGWQFTNDDETTVKIANRLPDLSIVPDFTG